MFVMFFSDAMMDSFETSSSFNRTTTLSHFGGVDCCLLIQPD
jgi:hypothetical protein